jgi:hypothetical protein
MINIGYSFITHNDNRSHKRFEMRRKITLSPIKDQINNQSSITESNQDLLPDLD